MQLPVRLRKLTFIPVLSLLLASIEPASAAKVLYRYKNNEGVIVLGVSIPKEFQKNGYEILNIKGRVLETIPPALTEEEKADLRQQRRDDRVAKRRKEEQDKIDRQLLRMYSHPDDVIKALTRKLRDMSGVKQLKQGTISSLRSELQDIQEDAAERERSGKTIPEKLLTKMDDIEIEIQSLKSEIEKQEKIMESIRQDYLDDINRVEFLTRKNPTLPIPEIP
ncbi:ABC transporter ATPase [Oleiphilus messinensis]|uniref:ABC transporter ATPase n=1 Tax=Oleiphilus messinensis TaxID=141451 RepID=A0A1Y0I5E4_9GAMM|nr:ABC transporter ATPase [Oleiphilus messinensis]